jgi:hypothetical protein
MRNRLGIVVALALASLTTACGAGVRAIDRGRLALPTMTADDMTVGLDGHVRAVSEGATGSLGGAGGGCGCN